MSSLVDFIRANWHEVPSAAVIPDDVEFAVIWTGGRQITHYAPGDTGTDFRRAGCRFPRFTSEPLPEPEPKFVLPTEPGSVVIAHTEYDHKRRPFIRVPWGGTRPWVDRSSTWSPGKLIDPEPARVVPNGIGVMDETDKRDRLDCDGDRWEWDDDRDLWHRSACIASRLMFGTLAALDREFGPLRFADEEA